MKLYNTRTNTKGIVKHRR